MRCKRLVVQAGRGTEGLWPANARLASASFHPSGSLSGSRGHSIAVHRRRWLRGRPSKVRVARRGLWDGRGVHWGWRTPSARIGAASEWSYDHIGGRFVLGKSRGRGRGAGGGWDTDYLEPELDCDWGEALAGRFPDKFLGWKDSRVDGTGSQRVKFLLFPIRIGSATTCHRAGVVPSYTRWRRA